MDKIKENQDIVLIDKNQKKYLINTGQKTDKYKGIGVIDPSSLIGKEFGKKIPIKNKEFIIFLPRIKDKMEGLKRKAQIILPRDAAQIIMSCSIKSGDTVLESGIGSGSLTIALANIVSPGGRVISYDNREDFIRHAKKNLRRAGLEEYVETKLQDVTEKISEKNLDAVILDIPNPWDGVKHAWESLKIGGYLCCYSPLTSQVEKTVKEINKHGFMEINTIENIQRRMIVTDRGMRPSFDMLGHTGYMTFARKTIDKI